MVESNSNRFRSPSVFKTVQGPALITFHVVVWVGRIELPHQVSKTRRLPLSYTQNVLVDRRRIELLLHACKAHVLPLSLTAHKLLARELGIEPRTTESKSVVLPLHHSRTNF